MCPDICLQWTITREMIELMFNTFHCIIVERQTEAVNFKNEVIDSFFLIDLSINKHFIYKMFIKCFKFPETNVMA